MDLPRVVTSTLYTVVMISLLNASHGSINDSWHSAIAPIAFFFASLAAASSAHITGSDEYYAALKLTATLGYVGAIALVSRAFVAWYMVLLFGACVPLIIMVSIFCFMLLAALYS